MKEDKEIHTDGEQHWYFSGKTKQKIFLEEQRCERCSKIFLGSTKRTQKFCSNDCQFDRNRPGTKLIESIPGSLTKRRVKEVPCKFCGIIRTIPAHRNTQFCNSTCRSAFAKGEAAAKMLPFTCPICRVDFQRTASAAKGYVHHYCSKKCSGIGRRLESGLYGDPTDSWKPTRKALFRFLNPQCTGCGEKRKFLLDLHHIDGNPRNNPWDGSNWEMLCSRCHDLRHLKQQPDGTWVRSLNHLTPRELIPMLSDPEFGVDTVPPMNRLQRLYEKDPPQRFGSPLDAVA